MYTDTDRHLDEATEQVPVSLDQAAVDKVAALLAEEGDPRLGLRMAVRPGGCSGFSYEMFFDAARDDGDLVWQPDGGAFDVIVDPSSAVLLKGAWLRYRDGLSGAGFHVDNPNAQKTCGCGQSFS